MACIADAGESGPAEAGKVRDQLQGSKRTGGAETCRRRAEGRSASRSNPVVVKTAPRRVRALSRAMQGLLDCLEPLDGSRRDPRRG